MVYSWLCKYDNGGKPELPGVISATPLEKGSGGKWRSKKGRAKIVRGGLRREAGVEVWGEL